MPYAVENPEPGKPLRWRFIGDPSEAAPGEAVLTGRPPEDAVWDAEDGPREPTEAEEVDLKRKEKVDEIQREAIAELTPLFTVGYGDRELSLLLCGHVVQICNALDIPVDPRLSTVVQVGTNALQRRDAALLATTLEELEAS